MKWLPRSGEAKRLYKLRRAMALYGRGPGHHCSGVAARMRATAFLWLSCIFRQLMFSRRTASTCPSLAMATAHCQPSFGSSRLLTRTRVGVLTMRPPETPKSSSSSSSSGASEGARDLGLQRFVRSSSVLPSRSAGVPRPLATISSMATARFSANVMPSSCSCVRKPRPRSTDARERAIWGILGATANSGATTTSPVCACFAMTRQAMFSRRAASTASMVSALPFARFVESFQLLCKLPQLPRSCRRQRIWGPCPGMDMSQRKSM
mmetsp:Transcript_99427/g.276658  ORF Transcript_99427/g.276658 Transcript_99427/m.276658 type:complete len:265 (+) Transcript_99427:379-1173(+)